MEYTDLPERFWLMSDDQIDQWRRDKQPKLQVDDVLLQTCVNAPGDGFAKLVLADWLEEECRDDLQRAAGRCIRLTEAIFERLPERDAHVDAERRLILASNYSLADFMAKLYGFANSKWLGVAFLGMEMAYTREKKLLDILKATNGPYIKMTPQRKRW
jgi:uncharacterized protein (TIGR02996 family)